MSEVMIIWLLQLFVIAPFACITQQGHSNGLFRVTCCDFLWELVYRTKRDDGQSRNKRNKKIELKWSWGKMD